MHEVYNRPVVHLLRETQVSRGTDSFIPLGTHTTEGTGIKTLYYFRSNTMNTLNLIKKQIEKASALHDAQITHTSYRGVEYSTRCVESKVPHGTFCYRGHTYTK